MRYALVTGCDHGVGLSLACCLAERNYTVAACRLNEEERQIDKLAEEYPDRVRVFTLNIADDASVREMRPSIC